jgi:hypothetical protein
LPFIFPKPTLANSLHQFKVNIKVNNFGEDHHAKFIFDHEQGSSKVPTFSHMQQSTLSHFGQLLNSNFSTTTSKPLWSFTTYFNTHISKTFTI